MPSKIKQFITESKTGRKILVIFEIILFGICSFFLGRLSKSNLNPIIQVKYPDWGQTRQEVGAINAQNSSNPQNRANIVSSDKNLLKGDFFASNKGKKYYSVGCGAGKGIKIENRRYFATKEEAEKAGYEFSDACR